MVSARPSVVRPGANDVGASRGRARPSSPRRSCRLLDASGAGEERGEVERGDDLGSLGLEGGLTLEEGDGSGGGEGCVAIIEPVE